MRDVDKRGKNSTALGWYFPWLLSGVLLCGEPGRCTPAGTLLQGSSLPLLVASLLPLPPLLSPLLVLLWPLLLPLPPGLLPVLALKTSGCPVRTERPFVRSLPLGETCSSPQSLHCLSAS